ncbi:MAG: NAD(P)/FAD-dependent oxidoreductase [Myxococcales bacterium]|nr:MAG: NAD(P)/FAD-dependent oxidoreductase [Myxococcales bacterium]
MPAKSVDVVVVGAGPAGFSAAIVCSRQGLRTMLCDRTSPPIDKACGEGIMPTGVSHLRALGVELEAYEHHRFSGVRYLSAKGAVATGDFLSGYGIGMQRKDLSAALHAAAAHHKTLEMRFGQPVRLIQRQPQGIELEVGQSRLTARLVIGADGLHSKVRRWAGLTRPSKGLARFGMRQHFELCPWSNYVEVFWSKGAEAYVTPLGPRLIGVALLWDADFFKREFHQSSPRRSSPRPSIDLDFPALAEKLKGHAPIGPALAAGPMKQDVSSVIDDGLVLIGDAAGYLDALTGEGISLATAEALSLETHVVPLLRSGQGPLCANQLRAYAEASTTIRRPYYVLANSALLMARYPAVARSAHALLFHAPALFSRILQYQPKLPKTKAS